ncbi:MAG TPA: cyclodeaminase/cyclohydrolase family protein [Bacillota bacterium]|nr:cyclodeaminase/cyclohydrolase family protein [Bacillota bacterium]
MLIELTVNRFVQEIASASPAPGGGSVAALAGAQAAALISMYCNLSLNREKYGDAVDNLEEAGAKARALAEKLLQAIDEDTAAFNRVMEAYRLPRGTAAEKARRSEAIQEAYIMAAKVPLHTAEICLQLLELVKEVAGRGNPAAVTDLGVGNLQALAGLTGACYNVQINLGSIKDTKIKGQLSEQVVRILASGREIFDGNRISIEQSI